MSLSRFAFLMFFLASLISSSDTDPSWLWAVIKFTMGVVIVTEASKDDYEFVGIGIPKPPSLDGRAVISLSILEQGGWPVIAGRRLRWIAV